MSESSKKQARKNKKVEMAFKRKGIDEWVKMCRMVEVRSCLAKLTEFELKVEIEPPVEKRNTWIIKEKKAIIVDDMNLKRSEGVCIFETTAHYIYNA